MKRGIIRGVARLCNAGPTSVGTTVNPTVSIYYCRISCPYTRRFLGLTSLSDSGFIFRGKGKGCVISLLRAGHRVLATSNMGGRGVAISSIYAGYGDSLL